MKDGDYVQSGSGTFLSVEVDKRETLQFSGIHVLRNAYAEHLAKHLEGFGEVLFVCLWGDRLNLQHPLVLNDFLLLPRLPSLPGLCSRSSALASLFDLLNLLDLLLHVFVSAQSFALHLLNEVLLFFLNLAIRWEPVVFVCERGSQLALSYLLRLLLAELLPALALLCALAHHCGIAKHFHLFRIHLVAVFRGD